MALKRSTIALISAAVITSFGIGYLVYFDSKRRSDPNFKKHKKRERKKAAKEEKILKEQEAQTVEELIKSVLDAVSKETFPQSPEEKEAYFMEKVAIGENLIKQGEAYYDASVEFFYKALKIYPAPLELIMIYQKTLPEKVFRIVVNIMALEQQKRQNQFYNDFPPSELNLKLKELPKEEKDEKDLYGLTADKDFNAGEELYTESPLISTLRPELEGSFCNYCMKKLDSEKIECTNCEKIAFCSKECETEGNQKYHQFLCINDKVTVDNKANEFLSFAKDNNLLYPQMIAQFLSSMVAEEIEKNKLGENAPTYNAWDHIERLKQVNVEDSEENQKEMQLISELLVSKVPGIDEFLTIEIYLILKGKLNANCYQIPFNGEDDVKKSTEPVRVVNNEKLGLGDAIYKISSYIGKAADSEDANVEVTFKDDTNVVCVKSIKDIKQGDEIKAVYY